MHEHIRATDTLANERTFLAYARTSLAFIGFGFVIARFSLFTREVSQVAHLSVHDFSGSTAFGITMSIAGVLCGLFGSYRYVAGARALRSGTVSPMSDGVAYLVGAVLAIVGVLVAITLLRAVV